MILTSTSLRLSVMDVVIRTPDRLAKVIDQLNTSTDLVSSAYITILHGLNPSVLWEALRNRQDLRHLRYKTYADKDRSSRDHPLVVSMPQLETLVLCGGTIQELNLVSLRYLELIGTVTPPSLVDQLRANRTIERLRIGTVNVRALVDALRTNQVLKDLTLTVSSDEDAAAVRELRHIPYVRMYRNGVDEVLWARPDPYDLVITDELEFREGEPQW